MGKIFIIIVILLVVGWFAMNISGNNINIDFLKKKVVDKLHQGPVPEGYDEDYFRKTGITQPLEGVDG